MHPLNPFKWRHFEAEIILLCTRWYLRYPLSYRQLEEMLLERGLRGRSHHHLSLGAELRPELERRCRPHLKTTTDSWRVDETYVKVKGVWVYLYRAVDSHGNTLEFRLSATRDAQAAKRFFTKALGAAHTVTPRVITVDKNPAYPESADRAAGSGHASSPERAAPDQVSQQPRRAGSPLHQGPRKTPCLSTGDKSGQARLDKNVCSILYSVHGEAT